MVVVTADDRRHIPVIYVWYIYITHLQFLCTSYSFEMCFYPLYTDHKCSSTVDIYKIYVSQRKPVLDTLMQDSLLDYKKPTSYSVYSFGYPMVCSVLWFIVIPQYEYNIFKATDTGYNYEYTGIQYNCLTYIPLVLN